MGELGGVAAEVDEKRVYMEFLWGGALQDGTQRWKEK